MATAEPATWTREMHALWRPIEMSERWRMLQKERYEAERDLILLERKMAAAPDVEAKDVEAKKLLERRIQHARYL